MKRQKTILQAGGEGCLNRDKECFSGVRDPITLECVPTNNVIRTAAGHCYDRRSWDDWVKRQRMRVWDNEIDEDEVTDPFRNPIRDYGAAYWRNVSNTEKQYWMRMAAERWRHLPARVKKIKFENNFARFASAYIRENAYEKTPKSATIRRKKHGWSWRNGPMMDMWRSDVGS